MSDKVRNIAVLPLSRLSDAQRADWEAIVRERALTPTHLPDWIDIVADAAGARDSVKVLTTDNGGRAPFYIPIFQSTSRHFGMSLKVAELATNRVSYHAGLPCRGNITEAVEALLDAAAPWQLFRANNLVAGSETEAALLSLAEARGLSLERIAVERSPYLEIAGDWDAYLATRPKKFRYKLRRRQSDLDESEDLSLRRFTDAADCATVLDAMFEVEARSWKADHGLDIPSSERERPYYERLLPYLARIDSLRAIVLYADDVPVAYSLCCHWNGWYGHLKTSFDTSYSQRSPGGMVIDHSIQDAFAEGASEFDFLGDQDRHKAHWSREVRSHFDYVLFGQSLKPRLLRVAKALKKSLVSERRKPSVKPG